MESAIAQTAAVVSVLTAFSPLELIKLRLQTSHQLYSTGKTIEKYSSIRQCAKLIMEKEGVRSFWKGNTIGILRFFPNEAINSKTRSTLRKQSSDSVAANLAIAVMAGWTATSILYPVDILRQSLSTSTDKSSNVIATFRGLVRNHGLRYFYKGYLNSLLGTAVFRGSFNGSFDCAKSKARNLGEKTTIAYLCAVIAGSICYPIDIINKRRILINSNQRILKFGSNIWKHQGIKGFYKGSKLIPLQSITGALILMMFDNEGLFNILSKTQ